MGSEDLEGRLRDLRTKQQEAVRTHAAAQARLEQAQQARDSEVAALEELGFSSLAEAEAWVTEAEKEISDAIDAIRAKVEP